MNYWSVDRRVCRPHAEGAAALHHWDSRIYKCERKRDNGGGGKRAGSLNTDYIQLPRTRTAASACHPANVSCSVDTQTLKRSLVGNVNRTDLTVNMHLLLILLSSSNRRFGSSLRTRGVKFGSFRGPF